MKIAYILIPVAAFSLSSLYDSGISLSPQSGRAPLNPPVNEASFRSAIQTVDQTLEITVDAAVSNLLTGENGTTPTVRLNSGYEMPVAGIDTYSLLDDECVNSIVPILDNGVWLIDTAYIYHNETAVSRGIRQSDVPREEIFFTTKLHPIQFVYVAEAVGEASEALGVEYIGLVLLHYPGSGGVQAYKAMERAVADGKARSVGPSNRYIEKIDAFLPQVAIPPAMV